jgi:hypothetical protein
MHACICSYIQKGNVSTKEQDSLIRLVRLLINRLSSSISGQLHFIHCYSNEISISPIKVIIEK